MPSDCWKRVHFLKTYMGEKKAVESSVFSGMITINPHEPPIEVESAFGGLGIYKKKLFEGCRYPSEFVDYEKYFVDHVVFHQKMKEKGARFFIFPRLVNGGVNEHSVLALPWYDMKAIGFKLRQGLKKFKV